jgi:hypothetical protein
MSACTIGTERGSVFTTPGARAGIREVQISPDFVDAVVEHLDCLCRTGAATGPED